MTKVIKKKPSIFNSASSNLFVVFFLFRVGHIKTGAYRPININELGLGGGRGPDFELLFTPPLEERSKTPVRAMEC